MASQLDYSLVPIALVLGDFSVRNATSSALGAARRSGEKMSKAMLSKLRAICPTYGQFKKVLKADIALTVTLVLVFDLVTNRGIGQGNLLVCVAMIFLCPVKPVGLHLEATILSGLGVMISAAWSFLGMYLANLSRDHTKSSPFQVSSGAILAAFLLVGTFFFNWLRDTYPMTNFASILGCVLLIFVMTTAPAIPGFLPQIVWAMVIPIMVGIGVSLIVDIVVWPEYTVNNYLDVFSRTLNSFNELLTLQAEAFLRDPEAALAEPAIPLSAVGRQLQGNVLMLIEMKDAVQREILYSRLKAKDFSHLTRIIKSMTVPLHGISLSRVMQQDMYNTRAYGNFYQWLTGAHEISSSKNGLDTNELLEKYRDILRTLRPICNALVLACTSTLSECIKCLSRMNDGKTKNTTADDQTHISRLVPRLREAIQTFEKCRIRDMANIFPSKYNTMLLPFLFQFNLREYAERVLKVAESIASLEEDRREKQLRWPKMTLKKWIKGSTNEEDITAKDNQLSPGDDEDKSVDKLLGPSSLEHDHAGNIRWRDPDVLAPSSRCEVFFFKLYKLKIWLLQPQILTVLKTSIGCILLSLPAFFANSAKWYAEWRGQWTVITVVFWMFPSSGLLILGFFLRVVGTVAGAVFGIVIWEICQDAVLAGMYLDDANYNDLEHNTDPVWKVAGMRCLTVMIGVVAASIMYCLPFPDTGRVALRRRLAGTVRDISVLYTCLTYVLENWSPDSSTTESQRKQFEKLALNIYQQIASERILLEHTKYEPPLRGKYPRDKYIRVLEHVENMINMLQTIELSLEKIPQKWRASLKPREPYVATVLAGFKYISAGLAAKISLPPYLSYPKDTLSQSTLANSQYPPHDDPEFIVYAAFLLYNVAFAMEVQKLLEVVQDLVGVDTPGDWMQIV
ncbi:hypothetical protein K7432_007686 [Basidiobolus ranarum]|uniref:ER transporter 6TM N-terminal domain-containing protein n=1 Tax=Basidiobolus ranarum TaxID=34480 RepID=A0ABR2WSY0_9FUNG